MLKFLKKLTENDVPDGEMEIALIDIPDGPPLDQNWVRKIAESMQELCMINPVAVIPKETEEGTRYLVIAGKHRVAAAQLLGWPSVPVRIIDRDDDELRVQLVEVHENLVRNNPGPCDRALLTKREADLLKQIRERDGLLSQYATLSVREHAEMTGKPKDKVHRPLRRGRILGDDLLLKMRGTSLDKDVELDALMRLSDEERDELAERAVAGEKVSARNPKPPPEAAQPITQREKALAAFRKWQERNADLPEMAHLQRAINKIVSVLSAEPPQPEA